MSEEKETQDRRQNSIGDLIVAFFWVAVGLFLVFQVIIYAPKALFGGWFEASDDMMKDTAEAREKTGLATILAFHDFGYKFEVRSDSSIRVYIYKKNFMNVAYPDRDTAIATVGKAWCEDKGINRWYLPKVVLRDIQTGDDLGSYRCFFH